MALALTSFTSAAAAPYQHQGRALDSDGSPINGQKTVVLRLYTQADGSSAVWTEAQSISVQDGYYAVQVGGITPIPGEYLDGRALWLEVQIDTVIGGRQQLSEVPRATVASRMSVSDTQPVACDASAIGTFYFDTVSASARICDGVTWKSLGIANEAPTAPTVQVTPIRPQPGTALTCEITEPATDPEGQGVSYTYTWLLNGVETANVDAVLPGSQTAAAQLWTCQALASDGQTTGQPRVSAIRIGQRFALSYTGSAQTLTVPSWGAEMVVSAWGAAGGGGSAENGSHRGGAGGFVEGRSPVSGDEALSVLVGRGGSYSDNWGYIAFPAGGYGSARNGYFSGGGGGRSGVVRGATELFVAGGGGGAGGTGGNVGGNNMQGGGGGYPAGGNGSSGYSPGCVGTGGTQAAGGATVAGCPQGASTPGAKNRGADGGIWGGQGTDPRGSENSGGGGGDGYYGGGSSMIHGGGGGGSSYVLPSAADVVAPGPSTSANPPQTSHPEYAAGVGVGRIAAVGGSGRVVVWIY